MLLIVASATVGAFAGSSAAYFWPVSR